MCRDLRAERLRHDLPTFFRERPYTVWQDGKTANGLHAMAIPETTESTERMKEMGRKWEEKKREVK